MAARRGSQEPTFEVVGDFDHTDGPECAETFEAYGFDFDGAQRRELDLYFARDSAGKYAANTVGVSKPRQNGKSYAARFYAIYLAMVCGFTVIYSAHNGDTISEFFRMLLGIFEDADGYPDFAAEVTAICKQRGDQEIDFRSGGRIKFITRTNSNTRGATCDVLVVDEAQEMTDEHLESLLPTMSAGAAGDMQVIYIGTPPGPKCHGTVFRRIHNRAHEQRQPSAAWWCEWSVDELPGDDATEDELLDLAYATNPALGVRISERAVRNEIANMTVDGFARERLGWWSDEAVAEPAIGKQDWEACVRKQPPTSGGIVCHAVKFSPDGEMGYIASCRNVPGEPPHVELTAAKSVKRSVKWVADWLIERKDKVAFVPIDGRSKVDALITRLDADGFPKRARAAVKAADMVAACSMFVDAVEAHQLTHFGQQQLDEAVATVTKRDIGAGGGFGFENEDGTADMVEACALAYWAAMTTKRLPERKARVF